MSQGTRLISSISNSNIMQNLSLWVLAIAAASVDAPRASATARWLRGKESPGACQEFCNPASPCHGGCGCSAGLNCFVCTGCGDVNVLKCIAHSCTGFCLKPVC